MRFSLAVPCTQCTATVTTIAGQAAQSPVIVIGYQDSACYELTCPIGHTTVMILSNHKYDILFQTAAYAINDGYYREAVVAFTSSLERFFEFSIRCFIDYDNNRAKAEESWKRVGRQSERQLGAFIFLWLKEFSETAPLLTERQYAFRNQVVHDGKIPTRTEAIEYGDAVLRIVRKATKRLKERFEQRIYQVPVENVELFNALTAKGDKARMSMMDGTILRDNESADDTVTLEHYLPGLAKMKQLRESFIS